MSDLFLPTRRWLLATGVGVVTPAWSHPTLAEIRPSARRLFEVIDRLDVEHNWPAGVHVNWKTGVPDGRPERTEGKHTHCSAFVAAAAMQVGIYILRPPDHSQILLANAQYDWLLSDGAREGWRQLPDAIAAQAAANLGRFVVATYHNRNDDKPGHIALVRPSENDPETIREEGPAVTQAGGTNYRKTNLKTGFAGHPRAFRDNAILYFAHNVDRSALP